MTDRTVAIVADAAPEVGLGHVSRCSAVAAALAASGIAVCCLAHGAEQELERDGVRWSPWRSGADPGGAVTVFDGGGIGSATIAAAAAQRPVAVFHDGGPAPAGVNLVVAPIARRPEGPGPEWLGGLEFACLRRPFWTLPSRETRRCASRILVTTGASAEGDALAGALAVELRAALPRAALTVVRGPLSRLAPPPGVRLLDAPASLARALVEADVVVCTGGQTSLEAAACGVPTVLMALDEPQVEQAARLEAAGAAHFVRGGEGGAAARAAAALAGDAAERERMAAAAQTAVDGQGALRVAKRIAGLSRAAPRGAGA